MKKLIVVLLFTFLLVSCGENVVTEFDFNGDTYEYYGPDSTTGYNIYKSNDKSVQVLWWQEEFLMIFELNGNEYYVNGDSNTYQVSENGTRIVLDGTDVQQEGDNIPVWNDDIKDIINQFD